MGPNQAQLTRVFARKTGSLITETIFPRDASFEVVIECAVGASLHGSGARYEVKVDVVDFSVMAPVGESSIVAAGSLADAGWPTPGHQFVYALPEPGQQNEGHFWKAFASLKIGVATPDASVAESPLLVITSP